MFEINWLGTNRLFYNIKTGNYSQRFIDVIDFENFDWDWEGLYNYLDFGYSVFGKTYVKDVKFVLPDVNVEDSRFTFKSNAPDDEYILDLLSIKTTPNEVFQLIEDKIDKYIEKINEGFIILPLSGGFDSRLIGHYIKKKNLIKSYTYGISKDQKRSYEAVRAKLIADRLGFDWNQIELGNFHNEFDYWYETYGYSTHAHGMYQIEFYKKIKALLNSEVKIPSYLISGMIGDAWAGIELKPIRHPDEVIKLGYTHGMNADPCKLIKIPRVNQSREYYFERKKKFLSNMRFCVIEAMRFKVHLLQYLLDIPESLGFKTFAPFVDKTIALSMLRLSDEERKNRKWQMDFFKAKKLYIEGEGLCEDRRNHLLETAINRKPLVPLNVDILKEVIQPSYVKWINSNLLNTFLSKAKWKMHGLNYNFKGGWRIQKMLPMDNHQRAYNAYLTLHPLQRIIEMRNSFLKR